MTDTPRTTELYRKHCRDQATTDFRAAFHEMTRLATALERELADAHAAIRDAAMRDVAEGRAHIVGDDRDDAFMVDAKRFEWVLPILCAEGGEGDRRAMALAKQYLLGKDARAAIDAAMSAKEGGAG